MSQNVPPSPRKSDAIARSTTVVMHLGYAFVWGLLLILSIVVAAHGAGIGWLGLLVFGFFTFRSLRSAYIRATNHRDDLRNSDGTKLGSWD
jgi:hypothetical protein